LLTIKQVTIYDKKYQIFGGFYEKETLPEIPYSENTIHEEMYTLWTIFLKIHLSEAISVNKS
jgi:hypothetical protein